MSSTPKFATRARPTSELVQELRQAAASFDRDPPPAVKNGEMPFCRLVTEWMTEIFYFTSLRQILLSPHAAVTLLVEQVLRQLLPEKGEFRNRLRPYVESAVHRGIRERRVMHYRMTRHPRSQARPASNRRCPKSRAIESKSDARQGVITAPSAAEKWKHIERDTVLLDSVIRSRSFTQKDRHGPQTTQMD